MIVSVTLLQPQTRMDSGSRQSWDSEIAAQTGRERSFSVSALAGCVKPSKLVPSLDHRCPGATC